MAERQTYTVLLPFPTGGGHWSSIGQELHLLDVEANALRSAGRLELKKPRLPRQPLHPPRQKSRCQEG